MLSRLLMQINASWYCLLVRVLSLSLSNEEDLFHQVLIDHDFRDIEGVS